MTCQHLLERVGFIIQETQSGAATEPAGAIWNQIGARSPPKQQIGHSGDPEVPDSFGGPSRTRTLDPLIKSLKVGAPAVYGRPRKAA